MSELLNGLHPLWYMWGAAFFVCAMALVLRIWGPSERSTEPEPRQAHHDDSEPATEHQERARHLPLCTACNARPATMRRAQSVQVWFDRLWVIRWINELYGMPYRHTLQRNWLGIDDRALEHCSVCYNKGALILRKAHASARAKLAETSAQQQEGIAIANAALDSAIRAMNSAEQKQIAEKFPHDFEAPQLAVKREDAMGRPPIVTLSEDASQDAAN